MNQKTLKRDDFKPLLRKAGLKATPSRLLVHELLKRTKRPMSAQNVIDEIGTRADQATVYRILKDFKDRGLITPIDLRHNHAHYELADTDDHHHLVCTRCGRIEDIAGCDVASMYAGVLRGTRNFAEIREHSLELYGVCKSCARTN